MAADLMLQDRAMQDASTSQPQRLCIPKHKLPLDLLVVRHNPQQLGPSVVTSASDIRRINRDVGWAQKREGLLAAAAAGLHLTLFAYNLAFWGFEGRPPDRYWPSNPRIRMQVRPRNYGYLEGSKKAWFNWMSKVEGVGKE